MDGPIVILLVLALVKFVFIGWLLLVVFKPDLRQLRAKKEPQTVPTCMYCDSKWTTPIDEGQTRWDKEDLVLVTAYECQHCGLPFWHVERIPTGTLKR